MAKYLDGWMLQWQIWTRLSRRKDNALLPQHKFTSYLKAWFLPAIHTLLGDFSESTWDRETVTLRGSVISHHSLKSYRRPREEHQTSVFTGCTPQSCHYFTTKGRLHILQGVSGFVRILTPPLTLDRVIQSWCPLRWWTSTLAGLFWGIMMLDTWPDDCSTEGNM